MNNQRNVSAATGASSPAGGGGGGSQGAPQPLPGRHRGRGWGQRAPDPGLPALCASADRPPLRTGLLCRGRRELRGGAGRGGAWTPGRGARPAVERRGGLLWRSLPVGEGGGGEPAGEPHAPSARCALKRLIAFILEPDCLGSNPASSLTGCVILGK